ncbi:hypothetical protein ACFC1L_39965 [Streptomyces sp. NPDC056210]|uniref:hypothetical protein n=1 Tax=Streptomyces sp. NPDC056210 TaxID=3345746 RepID=UPI0035D635C1
MRQISNTSELTEGEVVLIGTHYFHVTDVMRHKFRGKVWDETTQAWEHMLDIPLPSPSQTAHIVDNASELFPL